jgi:hypothetical protein
MLFRRRQPGHDGSDPPEPGRPRVMNDEAFDDLTRALGSCPTRRASLKFLLLGIAGATVSPEMLAACNSAPIRSSASSPTPTATSSASPPPKGPTSVCPPSQQERCCTAKQLRGCENVAASAFGKAAHGCAVACTNKNSARCQACKKSAIQQTLQAYAKCTAATCLKLVNPQLTPATSPTATASPAAAARAVLPGTSPRASSLLASNEPVMMAAATPEQCNFEKLGNCRDLAATAATVCLGAKCWIKCLVPAEAKLCVNCIIECLSAYTVALTACIHVWGCSDLTFCDQSDICCDVGFHGCSGPAGKTCCAGQETCCGGTCCSPDIEFCCGQTCCSTEDQICLNRKCCRKCVPPFVNDPQTCLCICPSGTTECGNNCCTAAQSCCNGECVDTNTDPNNCGSCGNICPAAASLPQLHVTTLKPVSAITNPPCICGPEDPPVTPCFNSIGCTCCAHKCCNSGTNPMGPVCCNPDEECCYSTNTFFPNSCCGPGLKCVDGSCERATGDCCAGVCC